MWSGASRSTPINDKTDRKKPSAWRKGNRKTRRSVNAVSIAQSENFFGAPGRPDGDGRHASVASAESHSVTSPRWTKACSYADQFPTRYFVLYFGWTFDLMSRSCTRSGHRGQSVNGRFRSRNSGQLVDHNILGVAWISRRLSAVVVPVRGDAVRAVRPALRGRSAATRLEGVEHTATMSGPTAFCVGTTSGVRRRLKIPRLLAGANTREPTAASSQPKGCAPTPLATGGLSWTIP